MFGAGQLLCAELKRSVASMLPWDIPWYDPSHAVFFAALYGALSVIGLGVLTAVLMTLKRLRQEDKGGHH
ncbi:hypothetical protein [Desulfoferrobacter suflitae]|uniref:hypothetical protein n=1 Tax=Desulfoferrobacter suflitae TaxID=2865782 RepID=UPI002164CBEB|nr:hypothetical protein [Desulfoferrobacter suflitae]MCK8603061.1 hypothetical protein [Desulfoferrobacter suflitae]